MDGLARFAFDLAAQRAGRRGQHNRKTHLVPDDLQIADHVQGDQIFVQLRFLDLAQGSQDCLFR